MPVGLKNPDPSNSKISHSSCRVIIGSFNRQMFPLSTGLDAGQSNAYPKAGTCPLPVVFLDALWKWQFFAKPARQWFSSTRCNKVHCTRRECNMILKTWLGLKCFFPNLSELELSKLWYVSYYPSKVWVSSPVRSN